MNGNADTVPERFTATLGLTQFRYNIVETTQGDMNGEARTSFNFDYVNVPDREQGTLIAALIDARYSRDAETALINNELLHAGTAEYAAYQTYRAEVKQIVAEALGQIVAVVAPASVSMRQARLQLLLLDSYATVNAAISTMPEAAQIEWEYATDVQRTNPLIPAMAGLLGWSEADTAAYFIEAATL